MRYCFYFSLIFFLSVFHCGIVLSQNKAIDVQHYRFELSLSDSSDVIRGKAGILFKLRKPSDSAYFDLVALNDSTGKGMVVSEVSDGKEDLKYRQDDQHLNIYFNKKMPLGTAENIEVTYSGIPADGLIIGKDKFHQRTFFADNWPSRAHNWIPCNDHPADKASVEFIVTAPDHYQVISNGILEEETNLPDHLKLTHWKEELDLPTKVMVIGVAGFAVQRSAEVNSIPIWSWVFPENRDSGFAQYAISKGILQFYINYIGPYPYRKLANVQSKTMFGGMENASNIFYYENSILNGPKKPADYTPIEPLFAHETAHQWFGDEASETDWPDLWLSEGFATYMTQLYMEHKYGTDTLKRRMQKDRSKVIAFYKRYKMPVVDTISKIDPLLLLNANSYEKGSWVLHMLRRKLGDAVFQKGIRLYYATYKGKNASTEDFMHIMENVSRQNLEVFFRQWIYTAGQPVLKGKWKYITGKKELKITIDQTQEYVFTFPLQIAVRDNNKSVVKAMQISNKNTSLSIPFDFKPTSILLDPDVNLLFEGKIVEEK